MKQSSYTPETLDLLAARYAREHGGAVQLPTEFDEVVTAQEEARRTVAESTNRLLLLFHDIVFRRDDIRTIRGEVLCLCHVAGVAGAGDLSYAEMGEKAGLHKSNIARAFDRLKRDELNGFELRTHYTHDDQRRAAESESATNRASGNERNKPENIE